jgi:ABC-type sugar transport system ATPase subunit
VGKNGAGKSTLMNILSGIHQPDGGDIWVGGRQIDRMTTAQAKAVGIAFVHQHSQLIPGLSVAENIFSGELPTNWAGFVKWRALNQEARTRLQRLGLDIDVKRKVEGLSVAERHIIEIAKALFARARVIVLDEPTAALPKSEVNLLFDFVRRQRNEGAAFIYISHFLEEVFELCDSVTVLRDGRLVGNYPVTDLDQKELIRLISGTKLERFSREKHRATDEQVVVIQDLTRPAAYSNLNLTLRAGEVVGITGLEGCGKAMLAKGLFGLEPLGEGNVRLAGKPYVAKSPMHSFEQGLAYLPRDRHHLGIIGQRPVRENITLPILYRLVNKFGLLKSSEERSRVEHFIDLLKIVVASPQQPVEFLSGGNQQKVVFAKLTGTEPKVLLLDEPTQGVDVQAKVEIMKIIDSMSRQGVAIVFVSEELREMMDMCDRIIVMYNGRIVREFNLADPDSSIEAIMQAVEGSVDVE